MTLITSDPRLLGKTDDTAPEEVEESVLRGLPLGTHVPLTVGRVFEDEDPEAPAPVQCSVQNLALLKRNASSSGSHLAEKTGEHASESRVCLQFRKPSGGRNW